MATPGTNDRQISHQDNHRPVRQFGETEILAVLIREAAPQLTMFGLGLLVIAIGGVLLARHNRAAILPAIALALYLPQFFFAPEVRIAHGPVLFAGAVWWASSLTRAPRMK